LIGISVATLRDTSGTIIGESDLKTSWCDKLASTPAIGVFTDRHFAASSESITALAPLINKWVKDGKDDFNVAKQDAFSLELALNAGYHYGISPGHIFVDFRHRLRLRQRSGSVPTVEMLSEAQPFTTLIPEVSRRLIEATALLNPKQDRPINKIGIVSATMVSEEDAPPGVVRLIKYMGAPWKQKLDAYDYQVVTQIASNDKWEDKCIHHLTKAEGSDSLVSVKFDFQREYMSPKKMGSLSEYIKPVVESAIDYFEVLAEGGLFHAS
jgi:hypothetical protein